MLMSSAEEISGTTLSTGIPCQSGLVENRYQYMEFFLFRGRLSCGKVLALWFCTFAIM